jgi:hypothetical protein
MTKPFRMNYATNPGPRGNPHTWRNSFHACLGLDAARAAVGNDSPEGILGVPPSSAWNVIRSAYRALAKLHHPDLGGDPNLFRRIQAAYEVLEARR